MNPVLIAKPLDLADTYSGAPYPEIMPEKKLLHLIKRLQREEGGNHFLRASGVNQMVQHRSPPSLERVHFVKKRDQQFIDKHRQQLSFISNKESSEEERRQIILKRGGAGF